jgi:intracellular multiplication protein IcmK
MELKTKRDGNIIKMHHIVRPLIMKPLFCVSKISFLSALLLSGALLCALPDKSLAQNVATKTQIAPPIEPIENLNPTDSAPAQPPKKDLKPAGSVQKMGVPAEQKASTGTESLPQNNEGDSISIESMAQTTPKTAPSEEGNTAPMVPSFPESSIIEQAGIEQAGSDLPTEEISTVNARSPGLTLDQGLVDAAGSDVASASPADTAQDKEAIRQEAFKSALDGLLPLRPEEIQTVLKEYDKTREVVEKPFYERPTPRIVVQQLSTDPAVTPPVLKVATGYVTTINIVDATGAPWPIQDLSWAGDFEVTNPESGGNVLRITPMADFAFGNVSLRLVDLKTPLTLTLNTVRDEVFYRVDARVSEYGPLADVPLIKGGIQLSASNKNLGKILDGAVESSLETLDVSGTDGRTKAYRQEGTLYLRTPLTLLSPGWTESVRSADGMNVYSIPETPVVLLSDQGSMVRAYINEPALGE